MYENKDQSYYFSSVREDLINLIPISFKACNVLEIGCGNGATLHKLKQLGIAKVTTGVELFASQENYYSEIDHFFRDNIEDFVFSPSMHNSFDIIILGDVIEHLIDPWTTLNKIVPLLAKEGRLIASIPNIRYYKTLSSIMIKGDFQYEESGILDQTHLRFFCKKNVIDLFTERGLVIETLTSKFDQESIRSKRYWLNKITCGLLHDFFVFQYLIASKKNTIQDIQQ